MKCYAINIRSTPGTNVVLPKSSIMQNEYYAQRIQYYAYLMFSCGIFDRGRAQTLCCSSSASRPNLEQQPTPKRTSTGIPW